MLCTRVSRVSCILLQYGAYVHASSSSVTYPVFAKSLRHFRNNIVPKDVPGYRVCHARRMSRKIRLFPRVSFFLPASTASDERREWINGSVVTSTTKGTLDSSFSLRAFQRRKSWNSRHSLFFELVNTSCRFIILSSDSFILHKEYVLFYHQRCIMRK